MKITRLLLVAALSAVTVSAGAQSHTDLWDISQGSVVTAHSALHSNFSIGDMFGTTASPGEPGDTIFADQQGLGFVHFVEWTTPVPITLESLHLYATGDIGAAYGSDFRDIGEFRLYSKVNPGDGFQLLTSLIPTHPFPHFFSPEVITLSNPVVGQYFRADFVQYDNFFFGTNYLGGPRIVELDGFGQAVPEPGSLALVGGLIVPGAALLLRRSCHRK